MCECCGTKKQELKSWQVGVGQDTVSQCGPRHCQSVWAKTLSVSVGQDTVSQCGPRHCQSVWAKTLSVSVGQDTVSQCGPRGTLEKQGRTKAAQYKQRRRTQVNFMNCNETQRVT